MKTILLRAFAASLCIYGSSIHAASPEQILSNLLNGFLPQSEELTATPTPVCVVETTLYFTSYDATHGTELWKSNGTAAGTVLVKDIFAGSSSSAPSNLTAVGSTLYFTANDGINGTELWKSDGTTAGTVLVKDNFAGSSSSASSHLTAVGSTLYFTANDGISGTELWKSDGTTAGTVLVKDISAGSSSSDPFNLTALGSLLYFTAYDGINGTELWKSDGSNAGTVLVKDIFAGSSSSAPSNLTVVENMLFFYFADTSSVSGLWKSDGTAAGTVFVKDVRLSFLAAVGETLFFGISNSDNADGLWKIDSTSREAVLVKDVKGIYTDSLTTAGNTLFFVTRSEGDGDELWKSNGTKDGTVLVKPFTFPSYFTPKRLIAAGNTLFFQVDVPYNINNKGNELWKSDGTEAGTTAVNDLTANSIGDAPFLLAVAALMQIHFGVIYDRNYEKYLSELPPPFYRSPTYPLAINSGKPQNFTVKFAPKGKTEKDGHATKRFGKSQTTNKVGVVRSITITNIGKKPLTGLKISKDGSAAADFIIKGLNKKPLPRGKSITFDVIFRPKTEGSKQAFLHISSSESIENPFDLTLSGTGVRGKKAR